MNQNDYVEAGFRVFGVYGAHGDLCDCGNPSCEALYKHPRISNWQHTPEWSDEQLDVMEETGQFDTGFGVLCTGWLVVDVDARNGGVASYEKLVKAIPAIAESGFIVATGSGIQDLGDRGLDRRATDLVDLLGAEGGHRVGGGCSPGTVLVLPSLAALGRRLQVGLQSLEGRGHRAKRAPVGAVVQLSVPPGDVEHVAEGRR